MRDATWWVREVEDPKLPLAVQVVRVINHKPIYEDTSIWKVNDDVFVHDLNEVAIRCGDSKIYLHRGKFYAKLSSAEIMQLADKSLSDSMQSLHEDQV